MARDEKDEQPIIPIELPDVSIETLRRTVRELEAFRKRDELRAKSKFPVWKLIELEDYGTTEWEVKKKLQVAGVNIGCDHPFLESQIKATSSDDFGKTIFLVKTSHSELGLNRNVAVAQVYARGQELGLVPCPTISAICLFLQHGWPGGSGKYFFCSDRYLYRQRPAIPLIEDDAFYEAWADDDYVWGGSEGAADCLIFALPYK